jgi:Tfp pilus assembly protein PilZ
MDRPQRLHPRYAYAAAITLHDRGQYHHGHTNNISRGGLSASFAFPIAAGTEIDVAIQLMFDDGMESEPLRVAGRVAWCTSVDDEHQIGLSFRPLPVEQADYLALFLRFLERGQRSATPAHPTSVDERFAY